MLWPALAPPQRFTRCGYPVMARSRWPMNLAGSEPVAAPGPVARLARTRQHAAPKKPR